MPGLPLLVILGIALALALDAFTVAVGLSISLGGLQIRQTARLAMGFGFFQFGMPLIGWAAGRGLLRYIQTVDHWVAFGLLSFVGGRLILDSFRKGKTADSRRGDPTRGVGLLLLSLATSIDALAVGLSLAVYETSILYPALVIGVVAAVLTVIGTRIGPVFGRLLGRRAELAGGIVLCLIGLRILIDHL